MLTNFEYTSNGVSIVSVSLVLVEVDRGDGQLSIVLSNGDVFVISENIISKEEHTDNSDLFECLDGSRYYLEYPEF